MAATIMDLGSEMQTLQADTKTAGKLLDGLEKQIKSMGQAMGNLLSGISPAQILGEAEKTVKRTTTTVRKETKKAMAAFDEVQRIDTADTTTTVTQSVTTTTTEQPKSEGGQEMQAQWAEDIDLTPVIAAFAMLQAQIGAVQTMLIGATAAMTAWNVLCTVTTAVTTALGAVMQFLTSPIGLVILAIGALIAIVVLLVQNWDTVKTKTTEIWNAIVGMLSTAAQWVNEHVLQPLMGFFTSAFGKVSEFLKGVFAKDWTEQFGAFGNVLNAFFTNVQNIWNAVKNIFSGIVSFVKNVFAGNWSGAWNSIVQIFKGIWNYLVAVVKAPINGIIGMINGLVGGVVSGINVVIRALNQLKIDIPDWVPGLGGQKFGFNITPLTAPKIPLLAQGAVLPANKPFMAVVGDQKHGTNVEAPLDVIKQAVAEVMAQSGGGDVAIRFTGDLAQLGRVLKPVIERENRRVGGSLVRGGV